MVSAYKIEGTINEIADMKIALVLLSFHFILVQGVLQNVSSNKSAEVPIGLSETINGLNPSQLSILVDKSYAYEDVDEFIKLLHSRYYKSLIFTELEQYFIYIENCIQGSVESFSLIFGKPHKLAKLISKRNLAHRLNLFIFYWGAKRPPKNSEIQFIEPMRAVIITRPREKAFRVYYSQASPDEVRSLDLVNWFDFESLGLHRSPLLPSTTSVYSNLRERVLRVPVFHSPPWFWVNYDNDTTNDRNSDYDTGFGFDSSIYYREMNITGGRDHRLLTLLASSMNFNFVYIDTPGRTQGTLMIDDGNNTLFNGAIGLLQERKAHLLLGDVSLSWERRKVVEFSFFTLADSGAFVTHAPRRLNEALAVLRPFKKDVWPCLILTLALTGPMLFIIIAIPYKLNFQKKSEVYIYRSYLNEITPIICVKKTIARDLQTNRYTEIPNKLLDRCIWFTVQLFLKQSCSQPYDGYRAKFLMIVFWFSATYVLADVYSAQLTSQFARPAREQPINDLQKLQRAIINDGYRLYVESSSLEMLQNGTEIFRNLYALMKQQIDIIDSVECAIKLIADGLENKIVMGGRETLYFNMKQFGSTSFQLSQKLYTRYSAVAVQLGCPFLDSLNEILLRLFESGILDKMTNAEYESLSHLVNVCPTSDRFELEEEINGSSDFGKDNTSERSENIIEPINLRMLQGAFIALIFGYGFAGVILLLEILYNGRKMCFVKQGKMLHKRQKFPMETEITWMRYFINLFNSLHKKIRR